MKVYLDNAATTPIDGEVLKVITDTLSNDFGNPSSSHSEGRKARAKLEQARKKIAKLLNVSSSEIIFTSGGTEANNLAIQSVLNSADIQQVITTDIEHHAVLNTIEKCCKERGGELVKLKLNSKGEIDLAELTMLLQLNKKTFVSLMHGNNEVGNLLPLEKVANICSENGAIFHCDSVQTIGHEVLDLNKVNVNFVTCSAHKIHGPKGVGFLYVNKAMQLEPLFYGGNQEKGFRPGTENVALILGMAKALEIAYGSLDLYEENIRQRRKQLIAGIKQSVPGVVLNGSQKECMSTVVSVRFDTDMDAGMLLFQMDLKGVCVSGGSACSSGSLKGSHVLTAIGDDKELPTLRFSFSRNTTSVEIEYAVSCLKEILQK